VSEARDPLPEDPDLLVARALESILQAVPEVPGGELIAVESSPKAQPWAETAAPPGGNKRPLEEVVAEYAAKVAADPEARAGQPAGVHPVTAFFERFAAVSEHAGKRAGRRRWRGGRRRRGGRRGGGGEQPRR
jgi:hypothetical protein